jgi:hypothetical protein
MKKGATPMGAVVTAMLDCSYAQVAKSLNMPTHTYLGATDSKLVDAQAGLESGITAMIGALSGINMISGSGMLDFLACHSAEKLVIDAEGIAMAKRMLMGVRQHTETLATGFYDDKINFKGGDFLKQKITMRLFREEQHLPSNIIDRDSTRAWKAAGSLDAFGRARLRVNELLASYRRPELDPVKESRLHAFMLDLSHMDEAAALESLDRYEGPVMATHANCAALLKGAESNRHLRDHVIEGLIERDAVIGVVPFNAFLKVGWVRKNGSRREEVSLDALIAHIDHICQIAGDSLHAGIGSDFDGGFGLQSIPSELDSIADLQMIASSLKVRGYNETDVENILGGNWLRFLRRSLPS